MMDPSSGKSYLSCRWYDSMMGKPYSSMYSNIVKRTSNGHVIWLLKSKNKKRGIWVYRIARGVTVFFMRYYWDKMIYDAYDAYDAYVELKGYITSGDMNWTPHRFRDDLLNLSLTYIYIIMYNHVYIYIIFIKQGKNNIHN